MTSPLVWILFPGLLAVILFFLRTRKRLVVILATVSALSLAALAWWLPIKERFLFGPWTLTFGDTLSILGRRFILSANDRPAVVVLFLTAAFWFGASHIARSGQLFVPLGLGMVVLLTAAIAVEPFLYAALLIEMAVLISIPFLVPPGKRVGRGILRYLTYQTLGMPFILFTGWMLTGVEISPGNIDLIVRTAVLMGLGFAFLLAIFPFHTWIPMLAQEVHPYTAGFVFLLLPGAIILFGLGFLDQFSWLREIPSLYAILRTAGVLMVVFAGIWTLFQRSLDRLFGFALILDIGFSFIAIGLTEGAHARETLEIFFASLLSRGLGLGLWALGLSVIRNHSADLSFHRVRGLARQMPLAVAGILFALFSFAGLPLLAGFPTRLALMEGLALVSPASAFWILLGSAGLLLAGMRTLAVLITGTEETEWRSLESRSQRLYLGLGLLCLLLLGLFPHWFLPVVANLSQAFQQVAP